MRSLLCALIVTGTCAGTGFAGTVYVNNSTGNDVWNGLCETWDGGTCGPKATIQAGIDAAAAGDEVVIAPGAYITTTPNMPRNMNLDYKGKAITVRSTDPANPAVVATTVVDCGGWGRGFYFHTGETTASVLDGLTIMHGNAPDGGGIYCYFASPTVRRCRIINNAASGSGGGVSVQSGTALFTDCVISGNSAGFGGGLATLRAQPTMQRCVIAGNTATQRGGGVGLGGGGVTYRATLANCLVAGNTSATDGGGLAWDTNTPKIANCTFSGNQAASRGGAIHGYDGGQPYLWNCVVWGNSATLGAQIAMRGILTPGVALSVGASDVAGGQAAIYLEGNASLQWNSHNIDADPLFVDPDGPDNDPATWQDNDHHLKADSPCVNTAGDLANYPEVQPTDIDGQPRLLYGRADMGADEFVWRGDLQHNGDVDLADFLEFQDCFNGPNRSPKASDCGEADLDRDGDVDLADFLDFQDCFNGPNQPPKCH